MRIIKVYTSQFRYSGEDRLDITVKSGVKAFAPTWDMVMGIKNGTMSEEEYIKKYKILMSNSLNNHMADWLNLITRDRVTLVCYCKKGDFCHRVLLAKFLEEAFNDVEYMGEI